MWSFLNNTGLLDGARGMLETLCLLAEASAKPQKSFCLFGLFSGFSGCRQA